MSPYNPEQCPSRHYVITHPRAGTFEGRITSRTCTTTQILILSRGPRTNNFYPGIPGKIVRLKTSLCTFTEI